MSKEAELISESECESDSELITRNHGATTEDRLQERGACSFLQKCAKAICPCTIKQKYTLKSDDESQARGDPSAPTDKYNLVYICFFIAGAGFLFPFNSYIAAIDYFFSLYRVQFPAVSEIIPVTYLVVTLCASTLNMSVVEWLSITSRIVFGYVMFSVALFFIPMLDIGINNCTVSTDVSFYLTLASIVMVGIGSGFQQSSYYGLSSMLPPRYSQALLAGESVAGFIVALNRIFTKLIFNSERVGAIVFFVASLLLVLFCFCCYGYIRNSPLVKYHIQRCRKKVVAMETSEQEMGVVGDVPSPEEDDKSSPGDGCPIEGVSDTVSLVEPHQTTSFKMKIISAFQIRLIIISQIWRLMVTIFINYLITLLLFPGLLSEIRYDPVGDWTPVILITIFNLTDFIAKWLALIRIRWSSTCLMIAGFFRLLFVPFVILCVTPSPCNPVLYVGVIGWAVILTTGLGFSNGFFGSLPMINVSMEVKREKDRELAGSIMIWSVLFGLCIGSVLAYSLTPLTKLDQTCALNSSAPITFSCYDNDTSIT